MSIPSKKLMLRYSTASLAPQNFHRKFSALGEDQC